VDGGLRDLVPLRKVVEAGCRYAIVILTLPLTSRSKRLRTALRAVSWRTTRKYSVALRKALFSVDVEYNSTMDRLGKPGSGDREATRLLVIAPRGRWDLVTRMTIDSRRLMRCAQRARQDTWRAFGLTPPTDSPYA